MTFTYSNKSSDIAIILVSPQMGENIGATARAMKNFGLLDLRIISPRDGWPNEKAESMSVGAIDLIKNAKIYDSVNAGIEDLEYVYAATATPRDMNKQYVLSRDVCVEIANANYKKIGIMFGPENSGLNNNDIALANKILTIDTNINFSSLNIAHAVAVICYELFQNKDQLRNDLQNNQNLATKAELEYFYNHLFTELDSRDFFRSTEKKEKMAFKIRNIFAKIDDLSQTELQTLRGIVNVLSKKE